MFVTDNQIFYFCESLFIGIICGIIYEPFGFFSGITGKRAVEIATDIIFFIFVFFAYFFLSVFFSFPKFRFYLYAGTIIGFMLWQLSAHKILAKCYKPVYNRIYLLRRKINDGIKNAAARIGRNGNGGNTVRSSHSVFGVPVSGNGRKKVKNRKIANGNHRVTRGKKEPRKRNRPLAARMENRGEGSPDKKQ